MCGPRRGPAPQQDVHSNAQINQRDQPQPLVQRTLYRNQNDHAIQRNGLPLQRVCSLRPRSSPVQLMDQSCCAVHLVLIYRQQSVAVPDAGLVCWPIGFHTVGGQVPVALNPPDTVVGNLEFALFLKINPREGCGRSGNYCQQNGGESNLKVPVHGPRRRQRPEG